jgi:hypothetical protein
MSIVVQSPLASEHNLYLLCDTDISSESVPCKYVLKKYDGFIEGRAARISLVDLLSKQLSISDPEIGRIDDLNRILSIRHDSRYKPCPERQREGNYQHNPFSISIL